MFVCLLVTAVSPEKMAEPIKMPFAMCNLGAQLPRPRMARRPTIRARISQGKRQFVEGDVVSGTTIILAIIRPNRMYSIS